MRSNVEPGLAVVDVERVVHVARRVAGREVERAEVVPVVFDLGALGHRKPSPTNTSSSSLPRLGHEVLVAVASTLVGVLGEVEALGLELLGAGRRPRARPACVERGLQRRAARR